MLLSFVFALQVASALFSWDTMSYFSIATQDVFFLNVKKLRLDAAVVNTVCVASQLQPLGM